MKPATELANVIMLRLNAICSGLNFAPFRGQHCTAVDMHVIATASAELRLTIAVSRNGRVTDMLPFSPGIFAFIREVAAASIRTASANQPCLSWLPELAYADAAAAAMIIAAMNVLVSRVLFMIVSFLRFDHTAGLLFSYFGSQGRICAEHCGTPDHTVGQVSCRAPYHAEA